MIEIKVDNIGALNKEYATTEKGVKRIIVRQKRKAVGQVLTRLNRTLPVWSGQTQDSIRVSEGARVSVRPSRVDPRTSPYRTKAGGSTRKPTPTGADQEVNARYSVYQRQLAKISDSSAYLDVHITADSIASDAGVFEGLAPNPRGSRNPKAGIPNLVAQARKGTIFE